jgi:hypothetical protein
MFGRFGHKLVPKTFSQTLVPVIGKLRPESVVDQLSLQHQQHAL